MANAVLLQALMTLFVAACAAVSGGKNAASSAALGGLVCLVPSALFALRLYVASRRPGGATLHGFFIGEFAKVTATLLLLFLIVRWYHELNWLAFLVGYIAVLKSYFLTFMLGRRRA